MAPESPADIQPSPSLSRIHFPLDAQQAKSHRPSKSTADSTALRSGRVVIAVAGGSKDAVNPRRRVVSVDATNTNGLRSPFSRRMPAVSMGAASLHSSDSIDSELAANVWGSNTFSDEYDLSHEGKPALCRDYPRILQDVHRALKLKHRREFRAKSGQFNLPPSSPKRSLEPTLSPPRSTFPLPSSPKLSSRTTATNVTSKPSVADIDFSPSTGPSFLQAGSHPVPFSADNGDTLDWTGYGSEEERNEKKWTLGKRKGKERELMLSADDLKRQEGVHAAKLARIQTISSQSTGKKVTITSDQLGRRYNLLYSSLSSGSDRFNILKVSRWYGEQENIVRSALEKAEPFPWLKHLDRQSTRKVASDDAFEGLRLPWHLSALIMEEYLHAQNARNRAMQPIPEDLSVTEGVNDSASFLLSSPPGEGVFLPTFPSPSRASPSRFTLSRHLSAEGRVSFEPLLDAPPSRPSNDSRRSIESTFSSVFSGSSAPRDQFFKDSDRLVGAVVSSPASSRLRLREGLALRRVWGNESDGGSSARNSAAEQSDDNADKGEKGYKGGKQTSWFNGSRSASLEPHTSPRGGDSFRPEASGGDDSFVHLDENDLSTAKPESLLASATVGASLHSEAEEKPELPEGSTAPRIINRRIRPLRASLPSEDRNAMIMEQKRKEDVEETRADMEYELKSQLVAQYKDSNTRIRSVLNRIAQHIREYEMCQSDFVSTTAGLAYMGGLPQDLLEAFSHDPANVTRSTKRLKMYRAVDDIHQRLSRQKAVFRDFLENSGQYNQPLQRGQDEFPVTTDILEEPIESLMQRLKTLEERRIAVISKEKEALEVLKNTQIIHATVKAEYNSTLAHTSVVYPEAGRFELELLISLRSSPLGFTNCRS
ncbi:hypothetical protein D9757_004626 [Collybiopsis confluens]|uniref:Uncharacterized protein n=1 Tax=Collybiopsis confluens TaxID=2823264 RepID=A0A8H5HS16_9AGAR|nr:hypothetical protein D9757_004626 [Collybiopsis confluens]